MASWTVTYLECPCMSGMYHILEVRQRISAYLAEGFDAAHNSVAETFCLRITSQRVSCYSSEVRILPVNESRDRLPDLCECRDSNIWWLGWRVVC